MLFKITTSDFFYKGKLFPEGTSIDLPDSEAKKIPNILFPLNNIVEKKSDNDESITVEFPKRKRKK